VVYSHSLADRVRRQLQDRRTTEKKMFGGVAFLLHGNMIVCVWQQCLIVRLGQDRAAEAMKREYVREFDVTGRPMKGWIMVEPDGLESDQQLAGWIELAWQFVESLPPK
jgi:hypothetical protein